MAFQDTSMWLHNKLGSSNDSWVSGSIVAQLNPEMLNRILECFPALEPPVKLKLILSFFQIPRRSHEMWRTELDKIISVAQMDSEPWVAMIGEILKTYPATGQLNSVISGSETNSKIFTDLMGDLKRALKKAAERKDIVLPLECHYLNKNAFLSVVGHQPQATKHFSLKRKPKAAALRAELLNKSQEAANKLKANPSGSFPLRKSTMPRKMGEAAPLKGLPSRTIGQTGFRTPRVPLPNRNPNKKEGGVKLLDITEQPIGYAAAKKRKRQQEIEEAKKTAGDQQVSKEATTKDEAVSKTPANSTPDYAAGLNPATPAAALPPPTYAPPTPTPIQATPTPAYAPPTPVLQVTTTVTNPIATQSSVPLYTPLSNQPIITTTTIPSLGHSITSTQLSAAQLQLIHSNSSGLRQSISLAQPLPFQSLEQVQQQTVHTTLNVPQIIARVTGQQHLHAQQIQQLQQGKTTQIVLQQPQTTTRIVQLPTQPIPQSRVAQLQQPLSRPPLAILSQTGLQLAQPTARLIRPTILTTPMPTITVGPQTHIVTQQAQVDHRHQQQPQQQPQQRRPLTLTKDQMATAQEMFQTANKVTRPEKALILGFMAGSRDNPCPHLGNIVTIKLSEKQQNVAQANESIEPMMVETHFQMNYSTGEWKQIQKFRRIEDEVYSKALR